MKPLERSRALLASLVDPDFRPTAIKAALVVGSILLAINHGAAIARGKMNRDRWISAALTYLVPYTVSVHGQHSSRSRKR